MLCQSCQKRQATVHQTEIGQGHEKQELHLCDQCDLDYSDFRSTGRLGCPHCYDAFAEALDPLLEKIHGQRHHVGKTPGESPAEDRSRDRKLVDLRRRLQALVRDEKYEEAALVRDELNQLEEEGRALDANR